MIDYGNEDYQTHVFTNTYTADVSGVCSAMYELGGMTVLHDPSGCNSTYSTHDEPRWFDTDSLMFVSGLDEMTAVLGDDNVLVEDVVHAAADLKPRFITLCGGSIPHIIAFDYKGVAKLIEKRTGIPTLPVITNGNRSYLAGVGASLTAWVKRFGDPSEAPRHTGDSQFRYNLLGVTPLDFSINGNAEALCSLFAAGPSAASSGNASDSASGISPLNCCAAMGESFDSLRHIYRASVNIVVSSAGRRLARYMEQVAGTPWVEGLPLGAAMTTKLQELALDAHQSGQNASDFRRTIWNNNPEHPRWDLPGGQILIIGEEIFGQSLAAAINELTPEARHHLRAYAIWPDPDLGFPEKRLIQLIRKSRFIVADPLYRAVPHDEGKNTFIPFPHEAYSGRIFREQIPLFVGPTFDVAGLLNRSESTL